jgi:2-haloacid dehalogenase
LNGIDTIIFDLGGVLIDWDPRYLYRKIFSDEEKMNWFLQNICTPEWNDEQDAGRSFQEATEDLIAKFPEHREPIRAWYDRWTETIKGPVQGSVDILEQIKNERRFRLLALTNWSAETFPWALENFHFLHWFEGIVVSGDERCRKPHPEIFQILFRRYKVSPEKALFIDDNKKNIVTASELGMKTIHFTSPQELKEALLKEEVLK